MRIHTSLQIYIILTTHWLKPVGNKKHNEKNKNALEINIHTHASKHIDKMQIHTQKTMSIVYAHLDTCLF